MYESPWSGGWERCGKRPSEGRDKGPSGRRCDGRGAVHLAGDLSLLVRVYQTLRRWVLEGEHPIWKDWLPPQQFHCSLGRSIEGHFVVVRKSAMRMTEWYLVGIVYIPKHCLFNKLPTTACIICVAWSSSLRCRLSLLEYIKLKFELRFLLYRYFYGTFWVINRIRKFQKLIIIINVLTQKLYSVDLDSGGEMEHVLTDRDYPFSLKPQLIRSPDQCHVLILIPEYTSAHNLQTKARTVIPN